MLLNFKGDGAKTPNVSPSSNLHEAANARCRCVNVLRMHLKSLAASYMLDSLPRVAATWLLQHSAMPRYPILNCPLLRVPMHAHFFFQPVSGLDVVGRARRFYHHHHRGADQKIKKNVGGASLDEGSPIHFFFFFYQIRYPCSFGNSEFTANGNSPKS